MHAALMVLGFTGPTETDIMEKQDIEDLEELKIPDDKEVESLSKAVSMSGGAKVTGGTLVSLISEASLNHAVFYLKFLERCEQLHPGDC